MQLSGLHLLVTFQCTLQCDHCFVWGSPWQSGTMSLENIEEMLRQAQEVGVSSIYFEGGEPFLYYAVLRRGVERAAALGFSVGIVSNAYWATTPEDAREWLRPFAGLVDDLSVSSDLYHFSETDSRYAQNAASAASALGIPVGTLSVAQPDDSTTPAARGQLPEGASAVMFRGRAAQQLAPRVLAQRWQELNSCPHEDLREPGRLHVDPFGNLHLCQGLVIGNLYQTPLADICERYVPEAHPIAGLLLSGGPAELVRRYDLAPRELYADACHLCYEARAALRAEFPDYLLPDQMYGGPETA